LGKLVATSVAETMEEQAQQAQAAEEPERAVMGAEAQKASATFEGMKGRLPWPVAEGFVSSKFGLQPHPVIKDVQVDNIGIDIRTGNGQDVVAVFAGKVTAVTKFTGMNYLVMVQHGNYFTVYANLEKVSVRVGQEVPAGKKLGTVFTNAEKVSELQFQVWRNDKKMDPEAWLRE
jgi:septal ring factor EnvC (AmiA/AmiB activator)